MPFCTSCGASVPERSRFCAACGEPLALVEGQSETRRTVTVVFQDVTGSTALGESLDPEAVRHVMTRYFAEMKAELEHHGGTVEKFIGDAVMAVFGTPAAHEDDPLRAIRATVGMRDRRARDGDRQARGHPPGCRGQASPRALRHRSGRGAARASGRARRDRRAPRP